MILKIRIKPQSKILFIVRVCNFYIVRVCNADEKVDEEVVKNPPAFCREILSKG